jgi:hypothetical protein
MDSLSTVLLAVGPAAITGLVGFAGARLQAQTAQKQARNEIDRLLLEQGDTARQQRQAAYHDFVTLLYRLDAMVVGLVAEPWSKETFSSWLEQFHLYFGCIDLYATDDVRSSATQIKTVLDEIGSKAREHGTDVDTFVRHFPTTYHDNRQSLIAAVEQTLNLMRHDIVHQSRQPEAST